MASAAAAAAITFFPALKAVPRPIRVLTVDGHQLVQEGLAAMINREEDMTVVATASTGEEALDDVRRYRPDVVTLDLLLPDMPGEDLARRILAEFPRTRIVAITSAQGHMHARRALDAGVHGYLSKAVPVCELVHAIRRVQAGERMIPGPVAFRAPQQLTGEALTAREIQVLQLVAWGNGNKQVAAQLSIAGETVRMHMRSILEKLAANDRAHAVTIAVTRGILRLGEGSAASAWHQAADWTDGGEGWKSAAAHSKTLTQ
jgi:two-component system NarL family response regulator